MATFNGAAFLCEQIDSILPQLSEDDELVISDDGSTDGTWEMLSLLAEHEPRVVLLEGPRLGVCRNFENALRACRGQTIVLCDQDDVWAPDKLDTVIRALGDNEASVVLHDATVVDEQGNEIHPSFFALHRTRTGFWKNLWKNSYIGCCMAFSRRLLPYVLPFPDTIPMHDQWIGLQGERHGGVIRIDRSLTAYRRHGRNATADTHASLMQMIRWRAGMIAALMSRR